MFGEFLAKKNIKPIIYNFLFSRYDYNGEKRVEMKIGYIDITTCSYNILASNTYSAPILQCPIDE